MIMNLYRDTDDTSGDTGHHALPGGFRVSKDGSGHSDSTLCSANTTIMIRVGRGAGAQGARGAKKVRPGGGARGAAKNHGALYLKKIFQLSFLEVRTKDHNSFRDIYHLTLPLDQI